MENLENRLNPLDYRSHCFPVIQNGRTGESDADDTCQLFRPLFQPAADPSGSQGHLTNQGVTGGDTEPVEMKRMKRFQEGVVAGSNEACQLVRQELEPSIVKFVDEFHKVEECFTQLAHQCASHIVDLALSMAHKVMGHRPHLDDSLKEQISQKLQGHIDQNFRLQVNVHPQDLKVLTALTKPHGIQRNSPAIQIVEDADIQCGDTRSELSAASNEDLNNWLA